MRHIFVRYQDWLLALLVPTFCLVSAWAVSLAIPVPHPDDYNAVNWEIRYVPGKWLYLAGRIFRGDLSPLEEDARLSRFLGMTADIRDLEATFSNEDPAQRAELAHLVSERNELENDVEATVEGRLTSILEEVGLDSSLPLFPEARWVFPPVDVEFDEPPRSLAVSPRARIELLDRRPLRPGLTLDEAVEREDELERGGDLSAIVGLLSGAATYPSIVAPTGDYRQLVSTVAHEWVHHYLFFKPLGVRYYESIELRTLNETVADIAGRALASLLVDRYPLPSESSGEDQPSRPAVTVDVDEFLRELRLNVESLLAAGQIDAAEALMEEGRLDLAAHGVEFRRINQAFFASRGLYADTPGSIDPLGEKLRVLLERSGDVGEFLRTAAGLTSEAELDYLADATPGDTGRR